MRMPPTLRTLTLLVPLLGLACTPTQQPSAATTDANKSPGTKPEVICPSIAKVPHATIDLGDGPMRANGSYEVEVEADGKRESCSFTVTGMAPSTTHCVGKDCMVGSPTTETTTTCSLVDVSGMQDDGSVRYLRTVGTPVQIGINLSHAGETLAAGTAKPDYTPDECGFIEPVVTLSGPGPAPSAAVAFTCPDDAKLELDLVAFTTKFEALAWEYGGMPEWPEEADAPTIADAPDYAPLLIELGMADMAAKVKLDPSSAPSDIFDCAIESLELQTGAGRPPDTLVRVDCRNLALSEDFGEDGMSLTSAVVLRSLGDAQPSTVCQLGGFTREGTLSGTPCLFEAPEGSRAVELSVVELLAAGQSAVREDDYWGSCGGGSERGDDVRARFHAVVDGRFQELFAATISEASYESPCLPESMVTGEVALLGAWPKQIQYTREIRCADTEEFEDCEYEGTCVATKTTTIHEYVDGRYAPQSPSPAQ